MSQNHVTKDGKCSYCGSKLKQCPECSEWFLSKNKGHIMCKSRCRTRKHRRKVIRFTELLTTDKLEDNK